jgi:hypothetical protein
MVALLGYVPFSEVVFAPGPSPGGLIWALIVLLIFLVVIGAALRMLGMWPGMASADPGGPPAGWGGGLAGLIVFLVVILVVCRIFGLL